MFSYVKLFPFPYSFSFFYTNLFDFLFYLSWLQVSFHIQPTPIGVCRSWQWSFVNCILPSSILPRGRIFSQQEKPRSKNRFSIYLLQRHSWRLVLSPLQPVDTLPVQQQQHSVCMCFGKHSLLQEEACTVGITTALTSPRSPPPRERERGLRDFSNGQTTYRTIG